MNFFKEIPLILVIFELVQPTKNMHLKLHLFFSILEHFLVYILQLLWEYFTYRPKKYPLSEIVKRFHVKCTKNCVLFTAPRQCIVCGKLAGFECGECFGEHGEGLDSTAFCETCLARVHNNPKRRKHKMNQLKVPQEYLAQG